MTDRHVPDDVVPGAFVALADTLADDFTISAHLHTMTVRCAQSVNAPAAGALITDDQGHLRVAAGSIEAARLLTELQVRAGSGPALECFRTGAPVLVADITGEAARWPQFTSWATQLGIGSVYAVPLRLRHHALGSLTFFGQTAGEPDTGTLRLALALAEVATVGLLQSRAIFRSEDLATQLQNALNSRVAIEQAKGILAERLQLDVDAAFTLLRGTARSGNHRLSDLAAAVIAGTATPSVPEPADAATAPRPTDGTA